MDVATFSSESKCKRKLSMSNCGNRVATKSCENLVSGALAILRLKTKHVEVPFCASCPTRAVTSGVATFIQRGPDSLIVFLVNDKRFCSKKRRCLIVTFYLLRWNRNMRHRRLPSQRVRRRDLLLLQRDRRWLRLPLTRVKRRVQRLVAPLANLVSIRVHSHDKRLYCQQLWRLWYENILELRVVRAIRDKGF